MLFSHFCTKQRKKILEETSGKKIPPVVEAGGDTSIMIAYFIIAFAYAMKTRLSFRFLNHCHLHN